MKKELVCIICPRGCALTVSGENGVYNVTGNSCPRGERYGIDETTHPTRTVTALVRVENRRDTMLSVKTGTPIDKGLIFEWMRLVNGLKVKAPVKAGTVILEDACGAKLVATRDVE
ncbi:MAG: DUF1667 domain-containing protein [Clostridia bacterium]|nr:DUF1667 domain-containing protein [Clostridia bacterium]